MTRVTAFAFSFTGLEGGKISLADYAGSPILIVLAACSSSGAATISAG